MQASAVKTNNIETAGPPLAEACPIAEKILAPIIAATPMKVKSRTPKLRCIWPPSNFSISSWSEIILSIDFLRKKEDHIILCLLIFKTKDKNTSFSKKF